MNDDATAAAGWIVIGTVIGAICAAIALITRRYPRRQP